jgi:hypothetical protein
MVFYRGLATAIPLGKKTTSAGMRLWRSVAIDRLLTATSGSAKPRAPGGVSFGQISDVSMTDG